MCREIVSISLVRSLNDFGKKWLKRFRYEESLRDRVIERDFVWNRRLHGGRHQIKQISRLLQLHRSVGVLLHYEQTFMQLVTAPVAHCRRETR